MKHIVIGSQPRSGSTFIQRQIYENTLDSTSGPETWYLQNFLFNSEQYKIFSSLGANSASIARQFYRCEVQDDPYVKNLIFGFENFLSELAISKNAQIFIEKTPRNLFYIETLSNYSDKIIPLQIVRRPLDVILSNIFTFSDGHFYQNRHKLDLDYGFEQILLNHQAGLTTIIYENALNDTTYIPSMLVKLGYATGVNACKSYNFDDQKSYGDPIFRGGDGFRQNRLKDISISKLSHYRVKKLMVNKSVIEIYKLFYSEEEYRFDLERLSSRKVHYMSIDPILFIGDNIYSKLQLNILLSKIRERRNFFLR